MGDKKKVMTERKLRMRYAGGLIKHLGVHMYSGAVPAVAELIANAWDADATRVELEIPLGEKWSPGSVIRVRDDGVGMAFKECNEKFLLVGRDRRRLEGDTTPGGRKIMAHKGIGKLACFGVAHLVEVRTVKDRWLTRFEMDYEDILQRSGDELVAQYEPPVLEDREVEEPDGTEVTLKKIQLRRAINEEDFRDSMARRFAVLSRRFQVIINRNLLTPRELNYQFRFPKKGLAKEELEDFGPIKWWVGFTPSPIRHQDGRGIAVIVRGKLAQTPFFFNLKGGLWGQHGVQYLTGEVRANALDEGDVDLIATDRASIMWEDPRATPLLEWGQKKVRELLQKWAEGRAEERIEELMKKKPYAERLSGFRPRERRELGKAIDTLARIETIEPDRFRQVVDDLMSAYEDRQLLDLMREINAADETAREEVLRLFAEWNVLEAIHTYQIVRGRLHVVWKFEEMIKAGVPEKPDMQDLLKKNPWLIEWGWTILQHERSLDRILAEEFGLGELEDEEGRLRPDFFCLADSMRVVVVEVKRPGEPFGRAEMRKTQDYVHYLRRHLGQSTYPPDTRKVEGRLILSRYPEQARDLALALEKEDIYVRTWEDLLRAATKQHEEFLDVVKRRAPEDDARIRALEELEIETITEPG